MGKDNNKDIQMVQDVDMYLTQIQGIIKQYRRLVDRLEVIQKDKKAANEKMDLLTQQNGLKSTFIQKKQAARAQIMMIKDKGVAATKENELKDLQKEYRDIHAEFVGMNLVKDRNELLGERSTARFDSKNATNDELLDKASETHSKTTQNLKDGLMILEQTKEQAKATATTLEEGREKINRISKGLDEVDSELEMSKKLITRFVKRIYTDKVIIAFTCLVVLGLGGVIIYVAVTGKKVFGQTISVPPNPFASPSPVATPAR